MATKKNQGRGRPKKTEPEKEGKYIRAKFPYGIYAAIANEQLKEIKDGKVETKRTIESVLVDIATDGLRARKAPVPRL